MSINKTLFILLFAFHISNAQKFEIGKVSIEELQEKVHPKDSTAVAAILFKKGAVNFEYSQDKGFQIRTTVKARIKIYKKEGYEWANQKVGYYIQNNFAESLIFDNAFTYNLVDGKIVKTKLKSDGEFTEKINKFWGQKKITMPNVKEGSVVEFEYTIKTPNIVSLKDWDFQSKIPVNHSEFTTNIPEYFIYNPSQKGYIFPKTTVEKNNKSINYNYRPKSEPGGTIINSTSLETLEFVETKTNYMALNLPAIKEEKYVNNIDNYISSVSNELSMIRYPNQPFETFSTNWESVTKKIYENDDFGSELKKTGYFEDDLNLILKGISNRDEKIYTIFNFVKSKVKWNDYTGYSCNDGVKSAYKNKTGNVAEINLMLTAMLRYAGIDANPVLISTRSNGIALFPTRTAFNYVISAVEIENDLILLDATERYAIPNILPLRDLNWFGRLIRKDGTSSEVYLTPKKISREITNLVYSINPEGKINGKIRQQVTDHLALSFRDKNLSKPKEAYLEELENENNNIEVSEFVRENDFNLPLPVIETFSFNDKNDTEIIGNKMYFTPQLFLRDVENPFKQEKREYPVDFGYPISNKYNIIIEIPEGYAVESMPKPLNLATGDNIGLFRFNISAIENKIQVQITTDINEAIVPSDFYDALKDFFKQMIEKQNEKIVLKKI